MINTIVIIIYVILTSAGLVSIKLASTAHHTLLHIGSKVTFPFNLWLLVGVALYGLSFLTYVFLISRFQLGYIIPLTTALVYVVIFIASFIIFKESFTILKIAAIIIILIGLALLNLRS